MISTKESLKPVKSNFNGNHQLVTNLVSDDEQKTVEFMQRLPTLHDGSVQSLFAPHEFQQLHDDVFVLLRQGLRNQE